MRAVYDLSVSPPTFDVVAFLVAAEMERVKRGEKTIEILIATGPADGFRRDNLPPRDPAERRRMLENIVKPMCWLLPSCSMVQEMSAQEIGAADFPVGWTPTNRIAAYGTHLMVKAYQAECFPLRVKAEKDQALVTITLREAAYWPSRNSNAPAWKALSAKLADEGYKVAVIHGGDLPNAYERAKLYASASLNLFVNNGPAWMATFIPQASCLVFKMCSPNAVCADPRFFAAVGFPVGSQVGRYAHRIVWEDDTGEVLLRETFSHMEEMAYG